MSFNVRELSSGGKGFLIKQSMIWGVETNVNTIINNTLLYYNIFFSLKNNNFGMCKSWGTHYLVTPLPIEILLFGVLQQPVSQAT